MLQEPVIEQHHKKRHFHPNAFWDKCTSICSSDTCSSDKVPTNCEIMSFIVDIWGLLRHLSRCHNSMKSLLHDNVSTSVVIQFFISFSWLQNNALISTVFSSHNSKMKNASLRTAPCIINAPKPRVWTRTAGVYAKPSLSLTDLFPSLKKGNLWLLPQSQVNRCYLLYHVTHWPEMYTRYLLQ